MRDRALQILLVLRAAMEKHGQYLYVLLLVELQQQYELLECSVKCIGTTVHLGCWCVMLFTFRVLDAKLKKLFHTMVSRL